MTRLGRLLAAFALAAACSTSQSPAPPPSVSSSPAPPGWTMFRGDLARDGHPRGATMAATAASRLSLAWQSDLQSPIVAGPVVAGTTLVIGTLGGTLEALSVESGERLWSVSGLGPLSGQPLIFEDKVFVGSSDGRLYAVELVTGTRIWDWRAPGVKPAIWDGPAVYRGLLLLGISSQAAGAASEPGRLVALDPASGDRLWATCLSPDCSPGDAIVSSIAVDSAGVGYVGVGSPSDALAAFDAGIGKVGWQTSLYPDGGRGLGVVATPLLLRSHGHEKVAVGGSAGTFAVLDARTGSVAWTRDLAAGSPGLLLGGSPGFDGRNLYIPLAGSPGGLLALAPDTGLPVWSHPSARPVLTSPAIGQDVVVYGEGGAVNPGAGGAVVALSVRDGHELWRQETPAPVIASPALTGNTIYSADLQGHLLAFRPAS